MRAIDRIRIALVIARYDFWLEWHDVRGRTRRAMRREMHANLLEAAAHEGTTAAIDNLGSIRALAQESAPERTGPTWLSGLYAALAFVTVLGVYSVTLGTAWLDGARVAAGPSAEVSGRPFLAPWVDLHLTTTSDGIGSASLQGDLTWWLVMAAAVFLLASRPWRLFTRRREPNRQRANA